MALAGNAHDFRDTVDHETCLSPAKRQDKNALAAGRFLRCDLEPPTEIDDRHHDAAQVHHAVDESWRLGQTRDLLGRTGDLVHRRNRHPYS